jgi:selT/selW/selH-like putative selenoprotein
MTELSLVPYADGRFEVFVDDDRLYSKLQTGDFPDDKTLTARIKKRL